MDQNVVDITEQLKKAKKIQRRVKWQARLNRAKELWDDNKQYIIVIVPALGYGVGKGIKFFGRRHNLKLEEKNKDMRCYDASLGHYWELKRKLSNEEWVSIDRRKKNGERLSDILAELRVLK